MMIHVTKMKPKTMKPKLLVQPKVSPKFLVHQLTSPPLRMINNNSNNNNNMLIMLPHHLPSIVVVPNSSNYHLFLLLLLLLMTNFYYKNVLIVNNNIIKRHQQHLLPFHPKPHPPSTPLVVSTGSSKVSHHRSSPASKVSTMRSNESSNNADRSENSRKMYWSCWTWRRK